MLLEPGVVTFVCLLEERQDAVDLSGILDSLGRSDSPVAVRTVVPALSGSAFFFVGAAAPRDPSEVYLMVNEDGLAEALREVPGTFFVAHEPSCDGLLHPRWQVVRCAADDAPLALAEAVVRHFSTHATDARAACFDPRAADLLGRLRSARLAPSTSAPAAPPGQPPPRLLEAVTAGLPSLRPTFPPLIDTPAADVAFTSGGGLDPFDLLIAASSEAGGPGRAVVVARSHGDTPPPPARRRRRLINRAARESPDIALAARLLDRAPTIVCFGSRKGGVGKTSHAAGVAIVAGTVLDAVGHRAAILDANIANPDAWGQLQLPDGAPTVRTVVAALALGQAPPRPVHATTPALACYPETREGAEYGRVDIRRLAAHLRSQFALTIVDMSNRLPDPTAGPEAAAAAFWLAEADALVLPTACSTQDFTAVLDYLDAGPLPPVVVPCLVPSSRRHRRHPVTQRYLSDIAERVAEIVELPDDAPTVRLAGLEGVAVQDLSAPLRQGYRDLAEAISRVPRRQRG